MLDRHRTAQPWMSTLARLVLAGVFVVAAWPKLVDAEGTIRSVRAFQLLPEALVRPVGLALPLVELVLALVLLAGIRTRAAALVTAALMVVFMGGIAAAWARGLEIACGCFGVDGSVPVDPVAGYVRDLLRDSLYLGLACYLAVLPRSRWSLDAALGTDPADGAPDGPAAPDPHRPGRAGTVTGDLS